jgi:hypothetical protein
MYNETLCGQQPVSEQMSPSGTNFFYITVHGLFNVEILNISAISNQLVGKHAKASAVSAKQEGMVSLNIRDYLAGFYLAFRIHLSRAG